MKMIFTLSLLTFFSLTACDNFLTGLEDSRITDGEAENAVVEEVDTCASSSTETFTVPGEYSFTIPSTSECFRIEVSGGGGGGAINAAPVPPSSGGNASLIDVSYSSIGSDIKLTIIVSEGGRFHGGAVSQGDGAGGSGAASGGGASSVSFNSIVVRASGGGGGGGDVNGGGAGAGAQGIDAANSTAAPGAVGINGGGSGGEAGFPPGDGADGGNGLGALGQIGNGEDGFVIIHF